MVENFQTNNNAVISKTTVDLAAPGATFEESEEAAQVAFGFIVGSVCDHNDQDNLAATINFNGPGNGGIHPLVNGRDRVFNSQGTGRFFSLEQTRDVDHRADIYSLGVVFYELLTGEAPMGWFQPPSKKVAVALERLPSAETNSGSISSVSTKLRTVRAAALARSMRPSSR